MKRICLVLLLASVATPAFAQHIPLPPFPLPPPQGEDVAPVRSMTPAPMPLEVQRPTMRAVPFDRIMYVLDVSGSMTGALPEAIRITGVFGSDDSRVAVVTFNEAHVRWEGVKVPCKHKKIEVHLDTCLKPGWAYMPLHNQELMTHLGSFAGSGGTDPTSALSYAYKNAPEGTLIVLVSDGQDMGRAVITSATDAIKKAQAWRRKKKLAPVQMLVWATSEADSKRESLVEFAKLGGSGLWRADTQRSGPW
jgi:hypothetical protein